MEYGLFSPGTTSSSFLFLPEMTPSEASGFFSLAGATTELQVCILTGVSTGKVSHHFFLEINPIIYEPGFPGVDNTPGHINYYCHR